MYTRSHCHVWSAPNGHVIAFENDLADTARLEPERAGKSRTQRHHHANDLRQGRAASRLPGPSDTIDNLELDRLDWLKIN